MSETTNNFSLLNVDVPDSVDNAAKNLTDLPTKNVGQTLADCWFLVFGGISQKAEKRKIKYALDLESFKISLEDKISEIPEENRIEAKTQIVMPALENAKYCVEENELREMFANLISASIDNRKGDLVHPFFGEALKTMSTLDAQILKSFKNSDCHPICQLKKLNHENESFEYSFKNMFLNSNSKDPQKSAQSISSLTRLGLLECSYDVSIKDPNAYDDYDYYLNKLNSKMPGHTLEYEKGIIQLTALGSSFLQICCP